MIMRVGPYLYRVKHVEGYIWHEGQRCLGLCDNDRHELLVSDVPSQAQQVQVICHEYIEAWLHHFGGQLVEHPDKETMCDLFGMAMTQFALDFMQQVRRCDDPNMQAQERRTSCAMNVSEQVEQTAEDQASWRVRIYEPAS